MRFISREELNSDKRVELNNSLKDKAKRGEAFLTSPTSKTTTTFLQFLDYLTKQNWNCYKENSMLAIFCSIMDWCYKNDYLSEFKGGERISIVSDLSALVLLRAKSKEVI